MKLRLAERLQLNQKQSWYLRSITKRSTPNVENQFKSYLSKGDYYSVVGSHSPREYDMQGQIMKDCITHLGVKPNSVILDIGCGTGRLAKYLEDFLKDGEYWGTDISSDAIDYAKAHFTLPNFHFLVDDGSSLLTLLSNKNFDYALFFSVFTHLYPKETAQYLHNCRVLTSKIIMTMIIEGIGMSWMNHIRPRYFGNRERMEYREDFVYELAKYEVWNCTHELDDICKKVTQEVFVLEKV